MSAKLNAWDRTAIEAALEQAIACRSIDPDSANALLRRLREAKNVVLHSFSGQEAADRVSEERWPA